MRLCAQIDSLDQQQGGHRDERSLLFGSVTATHRPRGKGTNETVRVELDNGVTGYHKPFEGLNDRIARGFGQTSAEQSVHEVAAWQLVDTDLVYDATGILHELDSVSPAPDGSTWLCRKDFAYAEHPTGQITVCGTHKRPGPVTAQIREG